MVMNKKEKEYVEVLKTLVALKFTEKIEPDLQPIGSCNRMFETMAFHAEREQNRYWDADVSRQISFESEWEINHEDADDKANIMHERVVDEISEQLKGGNQYCA